MRRSRPRSSRRACRGGVGGECWVRSSGQTPSVELLGVISRTTFGLIRAYPRSERGLPSLLPPACCSGPARVRSRENGRIRDGLLQLASRHRPERKVNPSAGVLLPFTPFPLIWRPLISTRRPALPPFPFD